MATTKRAAEDIDEYLAPLPPEVRVVMQRIRRTIKVAAPRAEERISYKIPCFALNGRDLIYFAAYKHYIGVYPAPRSDAAFAKELSVYKGGKGTVQFPLDQKIPYGLITRIVKFRMKEDARRASTPIKQS